MTDYTQLRRLMSIDTPLGPDALLLTSLRARARLNRLFQFDLELLAENTTRINFSKLLGQPVKIRLTPFPNQPRWFCGIVTQLEKGRRDETFTRYQAQVRPKLWLLTRNVQSRVFQQQAVPDILRQVLGKVLSTSEFAFSNLNGDYQPRDYCVQYRESDFAFLSRLMEEEGIAFYFRHDEHGHQLVITDTPFDKLEQAEARLAFDDAEGGTRTAPRISDWTVRQALAPRQIVLRDHHFALPGQSLEAVHPIMDKVRAGTLELDLTSGSPGLEIYDYPGGYAERFDGVGPGGNERPAELEKIFTDARRSARLRMEAETAQAVRIDGRGTAAAFHPGFHFELTHHPDGNGEFLVSRVEHQARLFGLRSGEDVRLEYHNTFSCLPRGLPYRPPRRTPRPVMAGTQTAVVVGPPGQELFLDKHGRVKVQFHWDRQGKKDASSSCWVRVAQFWAGKAWGAFFWPRVGQEVVVAFEEGDPDRPIVVGSVYNEENRPPFFPVDGLINGVRSCSSFGQADDHSNGILFYDKLGKEHLQIHSERDEAYHTESNKHVQVGGDLVTIVGGIPRGSGGGGGPHEQDHHDEDEEEKKKKEEEEKKKKEEEEKEKREAEIRHVIQEEKEKEEEEEKHKYFKGEVEPRLALQVEASFGASVDFKTFFELGCMVGHEVGWKINPLALALSPALHALHAGHAPSGPWGVVAHLGGGQEFTLGCETAIHYGPGVEIHRGPALEHHGELHAGQAIGALAVGAAGMATTLLSGTEWAAHDAHGDQSYLLTVGLMGIGVAYMLNTFWTSLEVSSAVAGAAREKAEEAQEVLEHANLMPRLARRLARVTQDSVNQAKNAVGLVAQAGGAPGQDDRTYTYQANHTLNARNITFRSSHTPSPVPPDLGGPTTIHLDALGDGHPAVRDNGGTIRLTATRDIDVKCDGGGVSIVSGPTSNAGYIVLQHGISTPAMAGNWIALDDSGIKIATGVQWPASTGPRIEIKDDEIKLAVGPDNVGASLSIKATAIVLKVGTYHLSLDLTDGMQAKAAQSMLVVAPYGAGLEALQYELTCQTAETSINLTHKEKVGAVKKLNGTIVENF